MEEEGGVIKLIFLKIKIKILEPDNDKCVSFKIKNKKD